MGFGLAVAVLIDATLVRTILVPAVMQLVRALELVDAGVAGPLAPRIALETARRTAHRPGPASRPASRAHPATTA